MLLLGSFSRSAVNGEGWGANGDGWGGDGGGSHGHPPLPHTRIRGRAKSEGWGA